MSTSTHTRQRRVRIADAGDSIARRETFVAGDGSLSGGYVTGRFADTGRMHSDQVSPFMAAWEDAHGAFYVVRSYGTPIAWGTASGPLTVPAVRYGVTTSKHQGIVRRASELSDCPASRCPGGLHCDHVPPRASA